MTDGVSKRDLGAGLVVLAIGIVLLFWSQNYPPRMSAMPKLVSLITIVLAMIDIAAQFETAWGRALRRSAGMTLRGSGSETDGASEPSWRRIGIAMLWVAGYVAAIYGAGLLLTTPVYIFLYMSVHGRKTLRLSLLSAIVTTAAIWFIFEVLFHYPLYPGILFGGN